MTAATADFETFYVYAYSLYQSGKAKEASEVFEILCARDPLESTYWTGLAASLQECREWERATKAWAMNALLEPEDPLPHFHAAQCCWSLGAKEGLKDPKHPLVGPIEVLQERWSHS